MGSGRFNILGGGGIAILSAYAAISNCVIFSNTASYLGGSISVFSNDAIFSNNLVISNTALDGGGLFVGGSARFYQNRIIGNSGGGLVVNSSSIFNANVIAGNQKYGASLNSNSSVFTNSVIADNLGAGVIISGHTCSGASPRLLHSTIARNANQGVRANGSAGNYSHPTLINTILVSQPVGVYVDDPYNMVDLDGVLWYSNTVNTLALTNTTINLSHAYTGAPVFTADGYHLSSGSIAINRGVNAGVAMDIDGELRDAAPDLGADELPVARTCWARLNNSLIDYPTVQAAIDAASPLDTVKIAGYCAGVQERGLVTQTYSVQTVFVNQILLTIRGGYTTSNWLTSDPATNPTTLDAQGNGRVILVPPHTDPTIENLRIIGGNAAMGGNAAPDLAGNGIYILTATAILSNNQVMSNTTPYVTGGKGFGVYLQNSNSKLIHNVIAYNQGCGSGGGVFLENSPAILTGNVITANSTGPSSMCGGYGGGLYLSQSNAILFDNTIASNAATEFKSGGGLCLLNSAARLERNHITGNFSGSGGGGLSLDHSNARLINNIVENNRIMWCYSAPCGSGLSIVDSSPQLLFTTIARNTNGSGVSLQNSSVAMTNTILVNQADGAALSAMAGSTVTMDGVLWYSNTIDTDGSGYISVTNAYNGDPAFAADGYHLTASSAAIDRGVLPDPVIISTDIDGDARPQRGGYDLGADEWAGWMNAQVSVARTAGKVALAWTIDKDGDISTNADRGIAIADLTSTGWQVTLPGELPSGADSPSVQFQGVDSLRLAFLVRGDASGGAPDAGLGNLAALWTAQCTASGWSAAPVHDQNNALVRAEQPRLAVGIAGESLVLMRRFGDFGTNGQLGQLALTQVLGSVAAPPVYLTDAPQQYWQPALAINQLTNKAIVLSVRRTIAPLSSAAMSRPGLSPASKTARPIPQSVALAQANDPVEVLAIEPESDPALDPQLALSQQHTLPNAVVIVTATVRNIGRGTASGLSVSLYAGIPLTGALLSTVNLPYTLTFNASHVVTFAVRMTNGQLPVYALITSVGNDTNPNNNIATADLSEIPPPASITVSADGSDTDSLKITWLPPNVDGVAGYRILRGDFAGGPYELVGEATGVSFSDVMLKRNHLYYYRIQAYDASGIRSEYSAEAGDSLAPFRVYMPRAVR